ncbi:MAG: OmpA family protein [Candidatus Hydrogenedentota bacterium]
MKKVLAGVLVLALLAMGGQAVAQTSATQWDDLTWWGNTGATPEPQPDATRDGYWWWPQDPEPAEDEVWGNQGLVYSQWEQPEPEPEPQPPEPPDPPPPPEPEVERDTPVLDNVLFDFDKSELRPEGIEVIEEVIDELEAHPEDTLAIEGHTCNIGTEEYNMGLGERRAESVHDYMVEQGIDSDRLETVSYGEEEPAVPNDTPAQRAQNRRVVFNYQIGD